MFQGTQEVTISQGIGMDSESVCIHNLTKK